MALQTPLTELKAPIGTKIVYQIRHLMGLRFLNMKTNFNVIDHMPFAKRLEAITGIAVLESVSIDTKDSGSYFFALSKDYDLKTVTDGIKQEFQTYFIDFD
jgi:hypothetical protein